MLAVIAARPSPMVGQSPEGLIMSMIRARVAPIEVASASQRKVSSEGFGSFKSGYLRWERCPASGPSGPRYSQPAVGHAPMMQHQASA